MIIKHIVELETVIKEDSENPSVKAILDMSEESRQEFFNLAGKSMIADLLVKTGANDGSSWAELRVAE
jgi:hypothetical protein